MSVSPSSPTAEAQRARRVALARQAFRDFYARCFWSYSADLLIEEKDVAFVVRGLRLNGGKAGYRVAAELCQ